MLYLLSHMQPERVNILPPNKAYSIPALLRKGIPSKALLVLLALLLLHHNNPAKHHRSNSQVVHPLHLLISPPLFEMSYITTLIRNVQCML
jgi:hypothetical protein